MNTKSLVTLAGALAGFYLVQTHARAQGSLMPPAGVPAPVMKSLDQIEARIPLNTITGVSNAMHLITQPGNYYLTADIVATAGRNGILINANNVSIDLNGFAITGTGTGSTCGITEQNPDGGQANHLSVFNGVIRNWRGTALLINSAPLDVVRDVRIADCGGGVVSYGALRISRCELQNPGKSGITLVTSYSVVEDCVVNALNGGGAAASGIYIYDGLVKNCQVRGVSGSPARGIWVEWKGGVIRNCRADAITSFAGTGAGMEADTVTDCAVAYITSVLASSTGIVGSHVERCSVQEITASTSSGFARGIHQVGTAGLVEQCLVKKVSGYNAYGVVTTNSLRLVNTHVDSLTGTGGNVAGIYAWGGTSLISGCGVSAVTNSAITATGINASSATVEQCRVSRIKSTGISVGGRSSVLNCQVEQAGNGNVAASAISASGDGNRIDSNHVMLSPTGITVSGLSTVTRNFAQGNTTNYSGIPASLIVGNYADMATATSPFVNIGF